MTDKETRDLARLIVMRLNQGWHTQAGRLYDNALRMGVDFNKLEEFIYEERYGGEDVHRGEA